MSGGDSNSQMKIVKGDFGYMLEDVPHLTDYIPDLPTYPNPLRSNPAYSVVKQYFVNMEDTVPQKVVVHIGSPRGVHFRRAGPCQKVYYRSDDVHACIVTCGGLCPGLNTVIREIVHSLDYMYGVKKILGIENTINLTPKLVDDIHKRGGTILGTSRGGHDTTKIVDSIQDRGINQVYIIGGDGTQKGAAAIYEEVRRRGLKVSVAGIPKTIDNDISVIDKSFGFDTAVEEAQRAINAAHVEAESAENGIGVVKLMGRYSGFIAMYATLASRDVDCCLIPESPFYLEGPGGLLEFVEGRLKESGHIVIVIAEGAGQELLAAETSSASERDASGNRLLKDVGLWLSQKIKTCFADPTYMIRAIPSNASDNVYCTLLAQSTVHGAMAGFTGFICGLVNGRHTYIPFNRIIERHNKVVITDRMWARLLCSTNQPSFMCPIELEKVKNEEKLRAQLLDGDANEKTGKRCILAVGLELVYSVSDSSPSSPKICSYSFGLLGLMQTYPNPLRSNPAYSVVKQYFVDMEDTVPQKVVVHIDSPRGVHFRRAGPRQKVYFNSDDVHACIVTCGGLCPGLNTVIREIVHSLDYMYGVNKVLGIDGGYRGFYAKNTINLTPKLVNDIHKRGGTILGTSRGGHDTTKIVDSIQDRGINQVYIIGGDGTQKGAAVIYEEVRRRGLKVSVAGIPKTIDNDIPVIDKSFGFDTAVEEAQRAINAAHVEAESAENGIGLVKLMGRYSGFIAMYATLASRDVDCCLIPESPFYLDGQGGLLEFVEKRLKESGHMVIVIAEGAGQELLAAETSSSKAESDASGNKLLQDVGMWLSQKIKDYSKQRKFPITLKYIDPTYMIRAIPSNASDNVYCTLLAQSTVHGAMAGFTGFTCGLVNGRHTYIPFNRITERQNKVVITDRMWARLLSSTNQPSFLCPKEVEKVKKEEKLKELLAAENGKTPASKTPALK
nr:ATP-dependent 6-phosphofructokinase 6-like [Ipomoea batatas]